MVCSSIRWGALALGLGWGPIAGACAHPSAAPDSLEPTGDRELSSTRREHAALKRRVQMLEDRVLRLERASSNAGDPAVATQRLPPESPPEPQVRHASPRDGVAALEAAESDEGLGADPAGFGEALRSPTSSRSGGGRYRLVGEELVKMTEPGRPQPADAPARGRRARATHAEYHAALGLLQGGQPREAAQAFAAFARSHPRSDLADNALYWHGEAAYDQGHYADALASFTAVIERYAGGNKATDALLKIGLCYAKLGDAANARGVLNGLIAAYPAASASDVARIKLAELSP